MQRFRVLSYNINREDEFLDHLFDFRIGLAFDAGGFVAFVDQDSQVLTQKSVGSADAGGLLVLKDILAVLNRVSQGLTISLLKLNRHILFQIFISLCTRTVLKCVNYSFLENLGLIYVILLDGAL